METPKVEILNAINLLLKEGFLLKVGGVITSTGKLRAYDELGIQTPKETATLKKTPTITLQDFSKQAEVPGQIKIPSGGYYNANRISNEAERAFNKLLPTIDLEKLVAATKQYYADEKNFRVTLTNYFTQNVWQSVYDNYIKKPVVNNPQFTGERRI